MVTRDRRSKRASEGLPIVHRHAAGLDIGSKFHVVAVPARADAEPVRKFNSFTSDLHRLADWLQSVGITTVAMESTGIYWVPVYEILEERGFEVVLVNARDAKNVPGCKTDVNDAQWLQRLHECGLLRASFRPHETIVALRAYLRHPECGTDMSRWPTAKHVTSWLTLAPGNKISGGKVLSSRTRRSSNRAAALQRTAAVNVGKTSTALGAFFRRLAARVDKAKAVTATARKIAVLLYNTLRHGWAYQDPGADYYEERYRRRTLDNLRRRADALMRSASSS